MPLSWRSSRRLYYLSILGLFLLIILLPVGYYLYPRASCADGRQNGDETGVDCGGSCETVCKFATRPPVVEWARVFEVGSRGASAVAYVTNPNRDLYAESVSYLFKIYDSKGILLASRAGVTALFGGSSFPVFSGVIGVGNEKPARASFIFTSEPTWAEQTLPSLSIKDQVFELNPPKLTAKIVNKELRKIDKVVVTAVLFDLEDNAYAASETVISSLGASGELPIVFTWPTLPSSPSRILIYPKTSSL